MDFQETIQEEDKARSMRDLKPAKGKKCKNLTRFMGKDIARLKGKKAAIRTD